MGAFSGTIPIEEKTCLWKVKIYQLIIYALYSSLYSSYIVTTVENISLDHKHFDDWNWEDEPIQKVNDT